MPTRLELFSTENVERKRIETYEQIDRYYDMLIECSDIARASRWNRDYTSIEAYKRSVMLNRARFLDMMGGWYWRRTDLNPRLRRLGETEEYTIDEVQFRAFEYVPPVDDAEPLDIDMDGILLIPVVEVEESEYGIPFYPERMPAIIAQHGLTGSPETVCGLTAEDDAYHAFGATLAESGYVVFAPRMITFSDKRQRLYRKSMLMAQRLMGLEMFKISRVVDYLQSLEVVDIDRIGIYGLSQGGQTALWVPAVEERITATVISAFFNLRADKMVKASPHYSAYIDTNEEDKHYFGQLAEFSDSDIGSLICPRPIFIESGTSDGAVWVEMAKREFEKLRYHYQQLGIEDRVELGVFEGGHEIRAVESLEFLDRWLKG